MFLCDETSQKMQWRSVGRVNDLRPGLSGLMNMLSVIGGKHLLFALTYSPYFLLFFSILVALDIFNLSWNTTMLIIGG